LTFIKILFTRMAMCWVRNANLFSKFDVSFSSALLLRGTSQPRFVQPIYILHGVSLSGSFSWGSTLFPLGKSLWETLLKRYFDSRSWNSFSPHHFSKTPFPYLSLSLSLGDILCPRTLLTTPGSQRRLLWQRKKRHGKEGRFDAWWLCALPTWVFVSFIFYWHTAKKRLWQSTFLLQCAHIYSSWVILWRCSWFRCIQSIRVHFDWCVSGSIISTLFMMFCNSITG
jgi:hypothetical protein